MCTRSIKKCLTLQCKSLIKHDSSLIGLSVMRNNYDIKLKVNEGEVSRIIFNEALKLFTEYSIVDVVVVGAGPSGLTAAYFLAKGGLKTLVLERNLGVGGGIRGGGMLLPIALVEEEAMEIVREVKCSYSRVAESLYAVNPIELTCKIAAEAISQGAKILTGVYVEDVIYRVEKGKHIIRGVVIQWTPIIECGWHVDPLNIYSKAVIDATGHEAEIVSLVKKKLKLNEISLIGEKSMWASEGERLVVEKTGKLISGLYVAGMAVAEVHGLPRMGPLLGGMLLSGKRVAEIILEDLRRGEL